MKAACIGHLLTRVWITATTIALFTGAAFGGAGGDHVPYRGSLDGRVTIYFGADGSVTMESDIAETSSHLGRGTQTFTSLDLTGFPEFVTGTSEATGANGDSIFLEFALW